MYKAYKFRLYPDNNQRELINKTFGCSRSIYNYYLSLNKETSAIYGKYKGKNYCNIEVDLNRSVIKLPKLKEIKIRGYRNLN